MKIEELRAKGEQALHDAVMAYAYTEIANIFSAFTWYIRAGQEEQAFEKLWSRQESIAYVSCGKGYRGQEHVREFFVTSRQKQRAEKLPLLAERFPDQVKNAPEYLGAGDYEMHWLTTPYIRVANDLKTAKGAWWSPGIISEADIDGSLKSYVRTINYGCDFILEDGAWKIWHLREFAEFSYPLEEDLLDMQGRQQDFGAALELKRRMDTGIPQPNQQKSWSGPYTRTRVPGMIPDIIEPYDTWDDCMSCIRDL